MARFIACACVASLFTNVLGAMRFINPQSMVKLGEFANAQSYKEGSSINVAWTPGKTGVGCSLALYQQNETDGSWYGSMEYLTQNAVDITSYKWLVGTEKNLTESNLFYLSIFQEGTTSSDDNSDYFYIEPKGAAVASPSATPTPSASSSAVASSASPTSSGLSTSASAAAASASTSPSSTPSPSNPASSSSDSSSGFPTAAKIGVGVGIPVALIIGLLAGFLLFRRRKKNNATHAPVPTAAPGYYEGGHGAPQQEYRYQDNAYAAPGELDGGHGRVEMSQGPGKHAHVAPVRYEM